MAQLTQRRRAEASCADGEELRHKDVDVEEKEARFTLLEELMLLGIKDEEVRRA